MALELFQDFNRDVFGDKLPKDLAITWYSCQKFQRFLIFRSVHLTKTAGRTVTVRKFVDSQWHYSASVELSSKVLDTKERLESTLLHELCHVAAWLINQNNKPAHGPVFKYWAQKATSICPDLAVTTCHNYEITYKYWYECTNVDCQKR